MVNNRVQREDAPGLLHSLALLYTDSASSFKAEGSSGRWTPVIGDGTHAMRGATGSDSISAAGGVASQDGLLFCGQEAF